MASAELDIWRASLLGRIEELLKAVDRLHADLSIILTVEELSSKKTKLATLVESRKVCDFFFFLVSDASALMLCHRFSRASTIARLIPPQFQI